MTDEKVAADLERLALVRETYSTFLDATDTFDGAVGRDLAYLLGAIARNIRANFAPRSSVVRILHRRFRAGHPVWLHVSIDGKRPMEAT